MSEQAPTLPKISDRILLHLSRYHGHPIDIVAPWALTQEGIASGVGAQRKNVAMPLKKLESNGSIAVHKRHIKGAKTIRKIYTLTDVGVATTGDVTKSLREQSIQIIDLDENRMNARIGDVRSFVTANVDILDIVMTIREGVLDCKDLQRRETRLRRKLVDMTERMPVVRRFFGRKEELDNLRHLIDTKTTKAILVTGLAGIGKTTLSAEFAGSLKGEFDVFWYKTHEWTGLRGLLTAIGEFLSAQGKPALLRFIESTSSLDLEKIGIILRTELTGARGIAIIDDFHKADKGMGDAVRVIFQMLIEEDSDFKLLLIGRSIPRFFDVRDVTIQKSIAHIELTGLDANSCRRILTTKEIPSEFHDEIISIAKGHPLFLELFDPTARGEKPMEFFDFMEKEIAVILSSIERRVMTVLAISRYPLPPDAFFVAERSMNATKGTVQILQLEEQLHSSLLSLKERNLIFEGLYGTIHTHDLLKEYFSSKASAAARKEINLVLSQYYIDDDSPFSANEAIFHLIAAEDLDGALDVATAYADEIISCVGYSTMRSLIDTLYQAGGDLARRSDFRLIKAKVEEAGGDWNASLETLESMFREGANIGEDILIQGRRLEGNILMRKGEGERAQELLMVSKKHAEKYGNDRLLAMICCDLGNLLHRRGLLNEARVHLDDALAAAERLDDNVLRGRSMYEIAKLISANENYPESLEIEEKALAMLKQTGALSDQAKVLTSMGVSYDAMKEYERALECQEEAYSLALKAGDVVTQAYALANSASTLFYRGELSEAKSRVSKASEIFSRIGDIMMLSNLARLDGRIYAESDDWQSADRCFMQCIEMAESSGQMLYLANWHCDIGEFYASRGRTENAIKHFELALEISEENSLRSLLDYAREKLKIFENKKSG